MRLGLFLLLVSTGCGDDHPYGAFGRGQTVDDDSDGYSSGEDCDDADPDANPGAEERCDGIDNDCDGMLDEDDATDATTWHSDADGDGFGEDSVAETSCEAPSGYVEDGTDCDDGDAAINPGADERCDDLDNDCDGDTDEDDAIDASIWYRDADSDGFGDGEDSVPACSAPSGYVEDGSDCDDGDAAFRPDADEVCNDQDDDCDGMLDEDDAIDAATWYRDADADGFGDAAVEYAACDAPNGYVADATDCDDEDAAVHPAAAEICNGIDDDCDGEADEDDAEDASTWYQDVDTDGFGDLSASLVACYEPSGHVLDATDCDDGDAAVNPDAVERCNGYDDDCDGSSDEDDAADVTTWYRDADADGFGDAASTDEECAVPSGYVSDATDCDDGDSSVHPDAAELCNGYDDDCDGASDEDDALDASTWYTDSDGDSYGDVTISTAACDQPSGYVLDSADCDDDEVAIHPAAAEVCEDGVDDDCDGEDAFCPLSGEIDLSEADVRFLGGSAGDSAGRVSGAGDVDGDGLADLLIASPAEDSGGDAAGAAFLVLGSSLPAYGSEAALADADATLIGEASGDSAGACVSQAGDVDADGLGDLLIGAYHENSGGTWAGAAYLVLGPLSGDLDLADADAKLVGASDWDLAAWSVSHAGDVDGDGHADLLVGAYGADPFGSYQDQYGAAYLLLGPVYGEVDLQNADARLQGEGSDDRAGLSVSGAGDTNGDGLDDILTGADGEDSGGFWSGAVYLMLGPTSGTVDLADADAKLAGEASGDFAGTSVSSAGDVDADGLDDILVGSISHGTGGVDAGAAYLVLGPLTGESSLADAEAVFIGEDSSDYAGICVSSAGDVDGEGHDDVLVGADGQDAGGSGAGAAYLLFGPLSGAIDLADADARFVGEASGDSAGFDLAGAGAVNGDGFEDVLIGAYGEDSGGSAAGAAYLLYGGGM